MTLVFALQSKDNIINKFWIGYVLNPDAQMSVHKLCPFLYSYKKSINSNPFLQMELFSQVLQEPGLDFEIQKVEKHLNKHTLNPQ